MSSSSFSEPSLTLWPAPESAPAPVPQRLMTKEEALESWDDVFGLNPELEAQRRDCRVMLGWRLMRALAFKQGRLGLNEPLAECSNPYFAMQGPPPARATPSNDPPEWSLKELLHREGGVSMMPPADERGRVRFCAVMQSIVCELGAWYGSKQFPWLADFGLHGLLHPDRIAQCWPPYDRVLYFEEKLVGDMQKLVVEFSRQWCAEHLRDLLGLTSKEAHGIVAMAFEQIRASDSALDREVRRHVRIRQLDSVADRARQMGDLNNELKARNLAMRAEGLGRFELEIEDEDYTRAVAAEAKVSSANLLTGPAAPAEDQGDTDEDLEVEDRGGRVSTGEEG